MLKRSVLTDAKGVSLHLPPAGASRPDGTPLEPILAGLAKLGLLPPGTTVHLDNGSDRATAHAARRARLRSGVARRREPGPIRARRRRVVDSTLA